MPHNRFDLWQSLQENLGKGFDSQIAASDQHEHSNPGPAYSLLFYFTVANPFISGYDYPILFANDPQPFRIGRVLRKVIIMDLDLNVSRTQNDRHLVTSELAVEKER